MLDPLQPAKELAEQLRFSNDTLTSIEEGRNAPAEELRAELFGTSLRVCKELTPDLAKRFTTVRTHLQIPESAADLFAYASPDIQATCFSSHRSNCVIKVASGLIDILEPQEFEFVLGHELGHFLLGHGLTNVETAVGGIDQYIQGRAQEISADRVGLWACRDLKVALCALIRTASGLGSQHLRFDVSAFMAQLREAEERESEAIAYSTHPSILVRCRALLWFSMSESFRTGCVSSLSEESQEIDIRIANDLTRFVDAPLHRRVKQAESDVEMWDAAKLIISDGVFSSDEQTKFRERFGEPLLQKLVGFLADAPVNELHEMIDEKHRVAMSDLESISPTALAKYLGSR